MDEGQAALLRNLFCVTLTLMFNSTLEWNTKKKIYRYIITYIKTPIAPEWNETLSRKTFGTHPLLKNKQNKQTNQKQTATYEVHKKSDYEFLQQLPVSHPLHAKYPQHYSMWPRFGTKHPPPEGKRATKKRYDFLKGVLIYALGKKRKNNGGRTRRVRTHTHALHSRRERESAKGNNRKIIPITKIKNKTKKKIIHASSSHRTAVSSPPSPASLSPFWRL